MDKKAKIVIHPEYKIGEVDKRLFGLSFTVSDRIRVKI